MGVFDHLRVESPLPDGQTDILDFQTKNLDCLLFRYTITADGKLFRDDVEYDYEMSKARGLSVVRRTGTKTEIPHHGLIRFYAGSPADWREYVAKFTDGRLVEIVLG